MMNRVACIGAGNVGRAWAILFAMRGCEVRLHDNSREALDRAQAAIAESLRTLQEFGRIADARAIHERIVLARGLAHALERCEYVQESAPEDLPMKRELFSTIEIQVPEEAILASSTSEIAASALFEHLRTRGRCLVVHPLNPPYLIPLVELSPSPWTSADTVARVHAFHVALRQKPILVRREITGFIANRLQLAVLGEALHLVDQGYCSVEDIDTAMKDGLARRWVLIGPFETGHLNATAGYRAYLGAFWATHRRIIEDLKPAHPWTQALIESVHAGLATTTPVDEVEERQAWRDRRLMALASHLEDAAARYGG
jgi:L-gulonate 3-dehydrogenase